MCNSGFEFEAFGATKLEALVAFRQGWDIYATAIGTCLFESVEFAQRLFPLLQTDTVTLGACYQSDIAVLNERFENRRQLSPFPD